MNIEITENHEEILRDALCMWLENQADDCHDVGRDDLGDQAIALSDKVIRSQITLEEALKEADRITDEKMDSDE